MLLRAMLVVAALAGTASARDVKTGSTAKVTRVRASDAPMILWSMVERDDAKVIALDGWLRPETYAIVDETGLVGMVDVPRVEKDKSCRNFTYESVRVRITGRTSRPYGHGTTLAVGPIRMTPTKAKVVYPYDAKDLPPDGTNELYGAVDLDGDDKADLVRYVYQCDASRHRRPGSEDHCVEIWARTGANGWRKTLEGGFPPCR